MSNNIQNGHIYQPVVFYHQKIKVGFHKEELSYPFYSPLVFPEPADATKYLSTFVKTLVESNDLPKDVVVDNKINENVIKTGVQELIICQLELKDDETD